MNASSTFRIPTRVRVARGARIHLDDELRAVGARRVFLISDNGVDASGWVDDAEGRAAAAGCDIERRTDVNPNPTSRAVDRLAAAARSFRADCVVGLGGGSALDAAKAVALLIENQGRCADFEGLDRFNRPPAPFIAIPTTCGTGSEVTRVSVITLPDEGRKISIKGDAMFPTAALVDADFIDTLPAGLIATTGMDALTHAVEAVIGRPANPVSDALASEAVRRLMTDLRTAAVPMAPDRSTAVESVMLASTLAGMAFGNADVGAVHCLSESIGGQTDLPHGLLNAALLRPVLLYQAETISDRLERLDRATGGEGTRDVFMSRIVSLTRDLAIPAFRDLGVEKGLHPAIARLSEQNGSNTSNLMELAAADYLRILDTVNP